jgi:hypothetical protein
MTTTIILNRSSVFDFGVWLPDLDGELRVLTMKEWTDPTGRAVVENFGSFDTAGLAELRVAELATQGPVRTVFGHSEYDLLRAARLREHLGLPGQTAESVRAYRNKALMKTFAAAAGIPVPPFRVLETPVDLLDFIAAHALPVVVKPVDGGGSRGVQVLGDRAAVAQFLAAWPERPYMVEGFVQGDMLHVDGLAIDGALRFAAASRYVHGCLAFQDGRSLGSVLLDPATTLAERAIAMTSRVIAALPASPLVAFHLELFHTPDDRLLLCEIASRTGGGKIIETIDVAWGVHLNRCWVRAAVGLDPELASRPAPSPYAGFLVIPPRRAVLTAVPPVPPVPWCVEYLAPHAPGAKLGKAVASVDHVAMMVVQGSSPEEVEARLLELDTWFAGETRWKEPDDVGSAA